MIFDNIHQRQIMPPDAYVIETCSDNDTPKSGASRRWSWANPSNTRFPVLYGGRVFCSTEGLWQGAKVFTHDGQPDMVAGAKPGHWRRAKKRRPFGHWGGPDQAPITTAREARLRVYLPAYKAQIEQWMTADPEVARWVAEARAHAGIVYLRDWDTGKGLDNGGPMSHGWLLAYYLNHGRMPE